MSNGWLQFLQRWLITTVAVLVAAHVVKGIDYDTATALLVASLLLGFLNAFVRPLLVLVSIAFVILTFGIGLLVINALLLWGVGAIVQGFHVNGFWAAFFGGLVISIVSMIVSALLGQGPRVEVRRNSGRSQSGKGDPPGPGPVIDV